MKCAQKCQFPMSETLDAQMDDVNHSITKILPETKDNVLNNLS